MTKEPRISLDWDDSYVEIMNDSWAYFDFTIEDLKYSVAYFADQMGIVLEPIITVFADRIKLTWYQPEPRL